jgi:hypothetical protein
MAKNNNPAARHPAYAHEPETSSNFFDPEQQDAMLAEMQSAARLEWKTATTIADRSSAAVAVAQLTQARKELAPFVAQIRYERAHPSEEFEEVDERPAFNSKPSPWGRNM